MKKEDTVLEVDDLYVTFNTYEGKLHAVRGISFDLKRGETLAIVGESGSGKSVTAKTIMGLLEKNATIERGKVLYNEMDLLELTDHEMSDIRGSQISMIFQDPLSFLNPVMKIGKQITETLVLKQNVPKKEAKERALKLMEAVGIDQVERRYNQYPFQFSGGMRQRIIIAIALACNPEILICDEPTTALDVTVQAKILELIKQIQKDRNLSVIFITHDLGVVANVADRVAVMYAGKIVEYGTVDEIFKDPRHPYTMSLLCAIPDLETDPNARLYAIPGAPPNLLYPPKGDAFAPRNKFAMRIDLEEEPPMFKVSDTHYAATWLLHEEAPTIDFEYFRSKILDKEGETARQRRNYTEDERPILEVKNLKQYFTSGFGKKKLVVKAVDDISFDIYKGETFGLVGESGCGKTTTGRSIIRIYEPTDGEVYFKGKLISGNLTKEDRKEITRSIQMIFQDPIASLNPRMTVKEIIGEGLRINKLCSTEEELMQRVYDMLEIVGLRKEHANRYPHEFSGGQRQRIGVARALIVNPELIIADEPVSALDVSIQAQVLNLLNDLKNELDLTLLFIAHDLSVVKYFSDRIGVMYYGKLVEIADSDELYNNPLHPYTKSLLSAIPVPDPDYERTRQHIHYDPSMHDYSKEKPEMVEIKEGHFIYASPSEVEEYKKNL
ncbi:peptide/nickel transport system ATP-binding protein [Keratinibaculum paraultunense]|uniref:Peptide/nickel transport system ATP-binding protein n=1 Tax=Keratinibaculum paraultunense TaxID=1278232 RepID=A0A4R3KWD2_9FIRM|nr:peptide/nickel transport system ATP-binding protein [Keratinibaculum paraultunense]